jgi:hypothetical protein
VNGPLEQASTRPATLESFGSYRGMRLIASSMAPALATLVLLLTASPSAARVRHTTAMKCSPGHSHVIAADSQAQVYEVTEGEALAVRGCLYGAKRSFPLGGPVICGGGGGGAPCGGMEHFTLNGAYVAYEENSSEHMYGEPVHSEYIVVVRNLHTGRVLHRAPTGTPLKPRPDYIGVGNVVAIVVKSDGAVAWIADDYERTLGTGTLSVTPYFDVEAVDKSGSRLLASGADIDPSSLALAVGGTDISPNSLAVAGNTLYWTQGSQPFSAPLD